MTTPQYIKSFSKGQITIPKTIREHLGIQDEFWLKIYTHERKIIAEPMEEKKDTGTYGKKLLNIKGDWYAGEETEENRHQVEQQLKKRSV